MATADEATGAARKRRSRKWWPAIGAVLGMIAGATADTQRASDQNIVETAVAAGKFETLTSLLKRAGLDHRPQLGGRLVDGAAKGHDVRLRPLGPGRAPRAPR